MSLPMYRLSARLPAATRALSSPRQNGTVAATRHLHNLLQSSRRQSIARNDLSLLYSSTSTTLPTADALRLTFLTPNIRQFSSNPSYFQAQQQKGDDVKDTPRAEDTADKKGSSESAGEKEAGKESAGENSGDKDGKKEKKKEEEKAPPPPHGDKSPWQVFTETLQSEFKASKEWNESTKALSAGAHQFTESESVKRARAAASKTSGVVDHTLKSTGQALGKGAAWTWDTAPVRGVRKGANALGTGLDKATKPVRDTAAYKSVKEAMDDGSSSRYGGWQEKEERRKARELRELNEIKSGKRRPIENMEEDPEAGTNVTVHKDSAWNQSWQKFKDENRMMQSLFTFKSTYDESENPLISTARSITDRVAGFFAENETAMVIKKFREMDPSFQIEPFLRDMREYILPEVLDAYVKGDIETLKQWLSAAQFQVYHALSEQWTKAGLKVDGKIVDIRHVDILSARLLEPGDIPVFIITCRTQEIHVYRKIKTGELAAGMEDKVQLVTYAVGVTRVPEDVNNPETRGWRLIELQKSARDYT